MFDICKDIHDAKLICPNFCNLCLLGNCFVLSFLLSNSSFCFIISPSFLLRNSSFCFIVSPWKLFVLFYHFSLRDKGEKEWEEVGARGNNYTYLKQVHETNQVHQTKQYNNKYEILCQQNCSIKMKINGLIAKHWAFRK